MNDPLHLTDEQFAELLFGNEPVNVRVHLTGCPQCSTQAAQMRAAVTDFRQQSTLWAERRAATNPLLAQTQRRPQAWLFRTAGLAVASLALLIAAGTDFVRHHDIKSSVTQSTAQANNSAPVSAATLKEDNELLSAIDGELRVDDSTTTSSYRQQANARTDRAKSTKRSINE